MRTCFNRTILPALCVLPLVAAPISQQDRDKLVDHLNQTREAFVRSVTGLSKQQLQFRPSAETWTVAECAEHITISEDVMYDEFQEVYMKSPPAGGRTSEMPDEQVLEYGTDRTKQKAKTSGEYLPTGRWPKLSDLLDHFRTSRDRTLNIALTTQEDLRGRYSEKIQLDAFQYLLILSAHTQRHTLQIEEIKASPGFPK